MSSLSNTPYLETLNYWSNRLSGKKHRIKFLLTKCLEIHSFRSIGQHIIPDVGTEFMEFPEMANKSIPDNPKISIVIPAYISTKKDVDDTSNLFNSIKNQTLKAENIIVVDDASPIPIKYPSGIIYYRLSCNSGPAKARNIGKQIALDNNADIIAFTDTDCILCENWIKTIYNNFIKEDIFHILSGNTLSYDKNWLGIYHNINGTLNGRKFKNSGKLLYGTTANLAITREVASVIDFNENFPLAAGEDIEFCYRANQQGYSIRHVPEMTVYHNYSYGNNNFKNIKKFRHQFKKYAQGEITLLEEIPEYYLYFDETEEIGAYNVN